MRLRVRYSKLGKIRWIGHRDLARVWERALRKAGVRVAWSEGFSPHPRISFGLALSMGHESIAEYLDLELAEDLELAGDSKGVGGEPDLASLATRLSAALPAGIDVDRVALVEPSQPSLQQDVTSCRWEITLTGLAAAPAEEALRAALASTSIAATRSRKGQESVDDIRPSIASARVLGTVPTAGEAGPGVLIEAELYTQPRGLRPAEFIVAVWPSSDDIRADQYQTHTFQAHTFKVVRTHQWIERDGARREPLPAEATDAPHAHERAS